MVSPRAWKNSSCCKKDLIIRIDWRRCILFWAMDRCRISPVSLDVRAGMEAIRQTTPHPTQPTIRSVQFDIIISIHWRRLVKNIGGRIEILGTNGVNNWWIHGHFSITRGSALAAPQVYAYVNMRSSMNHVHCSNPHHPSSVATALASLGSPASSPITSWIDYNIMNNYCLLLVFIWTSTSLGAEYWQQHYYWWWGFCWCFKVNFRPFCTDTTKR